METRELGQWCFSPSISSAFPYYLISNLFSGMRNGAVLTHSLRAGAAWIQSLFLETSLATKAGWMGR